MPRSSIDRLAPEVRAHIERRLREGRLTLDQLIADLKTTFPAASTPSRSALGRYRAGFESILTTQRAMSAAASALVAELGEDFDDKSGALLAQAVTTLATRAAYGKLEAMGEANEVDIADVLDLARAAKTAQEARSLNLRERQAIARAAAEKALAESRQKVEGLAGEVPADVLAKVIKAAYDL